MSQSELAQEERRREEAPRGSLGDYRPPVEYHEAPRLEPWLVVSLLAVIPMIVAFAIPKAMVIYAAAISGILLVTGVGMLIAQERK
jgi:hypothetical protein